MCARNAAVAGRIESVADVIPAKAIGWFTGKKMMGQHRCRCGYGKCAVSIRSDGPAPEPTSLGHFNLGPETLRRGAHNALGEECLLGIALVTPPLVVERTPATTGAGKLAAIYRARRRDERRPHIRGHQFGRYVAMNSPAAVMHDAHATGAACLIATVDGADLRGSRLRMHCDLLDRDVTGPAVPAARPSNFTPSASGN